MKEKILNSMFKLVATLMLLLHVLRGNELSFKNGGELSVVLYYGTIVLYIGCFLCETLSSMKKLYLKLKK